MNRRVYKFNQVILNEMADSTVVCDDLKERLVALEKFLADPWSDCYIERLLDVVIAAVVDSKFAPRSKENVHLMSFYKRFASVANQLQSYRRQPHDFHLIASLGRGAFGRVQLVREVTTGRVCAMKVLKKSRMLTQLTDYWTEREIMARGDSPWIVQLYYAFQDLTSLYMVMEYVPGGNLVGWMEEVEVISEAACRFYAAETVLALSDLHAMGFIHRDLKPDNLLLDAGGHVKLADFGTAIRVDPETHLIHCDAAVGTPDYLSPEVLLSQGGDGGSYGFEVDWWALGVLVYEMLYGDTPFYSEALVHTYAKIMSHSNHLKFPEDVHVSESGLDFMKQLLRDRESRLGSGSGGSEDVTNHSWFSSEWVRSQKSSGLLGPTDLSLIDWSWSNIRACRAPFQPQLTSETDTSYFQLDTDDDCDLLAQPNGDSAPVNDTNVIGETATTDSLTSKNSDTTEADQFLSKHPGVQLAFAGFSFSSSHPNHLALLNGLHLSSRIPDNPALLDPTSSSTANGSLINGTPDGDRSESHGSHVITPAGHERDIQTEMSSGGAHELARVRAQLEDALALAELQSNEVIALTEQLDEAVLQRRDLEAKLAQREAVHRGALEESQQRFELATAGLARLEAEVAKWKALAHSEQTARQSAEAAGNIALATATVRLAKRAAEVAERVAGSASGSHSSLTSSLIHDRVSPSRGPNEQTSDHSDNDLLAISLPSDQSQAVATNLLLSRVEEMAKRAHRAEAAAREAADMLEAEQHFCRLYKETSAEKSDQLKELTRELEETRELLASSQQDCRRFHEECDAARRALAEEQQRSLRYRETSRSADENAVSASRRAAVARREAAELRENLEQVKQAYETEKIKCAEAVKKLAEVMSGANTGALEIMYMASAQPKDGSGLYLGSVANRHKLAAILGNRQQQQLNHQSREIKRLQTEIKRLNAELGSTRREAQNMHAAMLEMTRLREESRFPYIVHSRENSDDTASGRGTNGVLSNTQPVRQRSTLFGRVKSGSGDTGLERSSATLKSSGSVECPADRSSPRHNSLGERSSLGVLPVSLNSTYTDTQQQAFSPSDFTISGLLQMGIRQQRKKKMAWCPRVVKLTLTHLYVWEYNPETAALVDTDTPNVSSSGRSPGVFSPNALITPPVLKLPLNALYRVRQVDPSEAIHEVPGDLVFAFQVTYDRCMLDPDASHVVTNTPATPSQSSALTLPRKFSFGSSAVLSTNTPSSSVRRHPAIDSTTGVKRNAILGSSNDQLNAISPSPKPPVSPFHTPNLIFIRGHKLQSIRFPRMAICDLCRKPCWQWASPPPAFQCVHCQLKFHASHLEAQDCALPDCGKAVASHLFRCHSQLEQENWIARISMAIHYTTNSAVGLRSHPRAVDVSLDDRHLSTVDGLRSPGSPTIVSESAPRLSLSGNKNDFESLLVYSPNDPAIEASPSSPIRSSGRRTNTQNRAGFSETTPSSEPIVMDYDQLLITDPPVVLESAHSSSETDRTDRSISPAA